MASSPPLPRSLAPALSALELRLRRLGVVPPGSRVTLRGWIVLAVIAGLLTLWILFFLLGALFGGDAARPLDRTAITARPAAVPQVVQAFDATATVYGPGLEGNLTANGEAFDMLDATAAHPSLPFDTMVRVTNPASGAQTTVRINDRLPNATDDRIDLTVGAAASVGVTIADGPTLVRLEVLG